MPLLQGKQIALGSSGIKAVNVDTAEIPTLAGTSIFTGDVEVPLPTAGPQAANKTYVDSQSALASVPTPDDKGFAAIDTSPGMNFQKGTNTTISHTPLGGEYIDVQVNGVSVYVADGDRTVLDCYFSAPGTSGAAARALADIVAGDEFYWNGANAGYDLITTDQLSFLYNVSGTGVGGVVGITPSLGLVTIGSHFDVEVDSVTTTINGSNQVEAAAPTTLNKRMVANTTTADGQLATNITIAANPAGYVLVLVNGQGASVADGTSQQSIRHCYFSVDGGTTARATSAIQAGDSLYWNGSIATIQLDPSDRIDFDYSVLS